MLSGSCGMMPAELFWIYKIRLLAGAPPPVASPTSLHRPSSIGGRTILLTRSVQRTRRTQLTPFSVYRL
jgi:hypothetical protein